MLKIDNSYIFFGCLLDNIAAWTWITQLDEEYRPGITITTMEGKIQLNPDGVIRPIVDLSAGTSFILFYKK